MLVEKNPVVFNEKNFNHWSPPIPLPIAIILAELKKKFQPPRKWEFFQ